MTKTVLLTGISGFIAKHVALKLLQAGYIVRGSLRNMARADEVRASLAPHLDAAALDRVQFVTLDLNADDGWVEAMEGVDALVHTASPFPIEQPKDENALIRPAVDGTLRALASAKAAGVNRVILTSSIVAIINTFKRAGMQDETDWCNVDAPDTSAYAKSKTLAERAAWEFVTAQGMALTTINPGLVLGAPLDKHYGSSVSVVARILRGRDPMLPMIGFACVDVQDVAEAHLRALQIPTTAGCRVPCVAGTMTMPDMARVLKSAYPARKISTRIAPYWLLRILARFDGEIRAILPSIGKVHQISNARARKDMKMRFVSPEGSLRATAQWLINAGEV
jgi:dihydroflavonol-4-reductase